MNFIEKMYCEECKSDFDRMDQGYHSQNEDCKHLKCKILSLIEFIIFIPLAILTSIVMAPILFILIVINYFFPEEKDML